MTDFSSEVSTFRKFMGNGTVYQIPEFQRDYSWKKEHWEDLWNDIWGLSDYVDEPEDSHYLGYLVIKNALSQSKTIDEYEIIDGQQRITTLSLMILAAIAILLELGDLERAEELKKTYIGIKNKVTLSTEAKLKLNRNNDEYYATRLSALYEYERIIPDSFSNKQLKKGFTYFKDKIKGVSEFKDTSKLVEFIELSAHKIVFTVMTVSDDVKAYKLFETLNARGVQLSSIDLLKNYLFSTAGNRYLEQMKKRWATLTKLIEKDDILNDLLRYYWNSKYDYVEKKNLFKVIKREITKPDQAFDLVQQLQNIASLFKAIKDLDLSQWSNNKELVETLEDFNLLGATQPYPFVFLAEKHFTKSADLKKVLDFVNVLTFRHSKIGGLVANDLEKFYEQLCKKMNSDSTITVEQIRDFFLEKQIIPSDKQFISAFEGKSFDSSTGKKLARYILAKIDHHLYNSSIDYNSSKTSLEHIAPENSNDWDLPPVEQAYIHNIGNLCLLDKDRNNNMRNTFDAKKEAYQNCAWQSTKDVFKEASSQWGADEIQERAESLVQIAVEIWKV
jgi:uncharacterized protein with ParB-like and HNH nuclease domain